MPDNCRHWQGLLAEHALTPLDRGGTNAVMPDDLAEHLAGCADCRATAAEFRSTAEALARTTAASATAVASSPSRELTTRIAARVNDERHRRRRRRLAVASVAAAVTLILASFVSIRLLEPTERGERVALTSAGMRGNATLQGWAWGTEIHLSVTGATPGKRYNVWLERADGGRVGAGTFIGVRNRPITVVLASAVPSSEAIALGISEPSGELVVRAPLD